jgi:hypothetical protein
MDAALVHVHLDPNSPKAQVFYKMGGSSNQSVDSTAPWPSGNITYTSHLCPFSLPTSSLSTILGRDKAIVFLSLMVLVSHILKRAKLHLQRGRRRKRRRRRRRKKKKKPHSHITYWLLLGNNPDPAQWARITAHQNHFGLMSEKHTQSR